MTPEPSLAWLLHPVPVDTFLAEVWGRAHCHIERGGAGYFAGLFDAAVAEDVLEFARPEPSAVRLVRGDKTCAPENYRHADGALDLVRIRGEFANGYTIVLNGLERYVPTIAALSHAAEIELNFEVQVNAYITPPMSRGFLPHFDDHDVLIAQIQGSKTWHIYEQADVPARELRQRDAFVASRLPEPSYLRLEAGDVLYIPRGRVHAAEANVEASIHLTFGVHAPTVLTLLTQALDALSVRDDRVMARLPPRHLDDREVRAGLGELVRDVLRALDEPGVVDEGLGALGDRLVRRGRCRPVGQMVANAVELKRIDERTRVAKYRPLYSRVVSLGDDVGLQFGQSLVRAGADHLSAMLFVSRSVGAFRVGDLPGLREAERIEFARRLVVDGFLVRVS